MGEFCQLSLDSHLIDRIGTCEILSNTSVLELIKCWNLVCSEILSNTFVLELIKC